MGTLAPAVPDIVEEHLEEFGFLAMQRRKLIVDWETDRDELAEHDERIAAHRDGLRVAGPLSVETALARLEDPLSAWDVFACVTVWIEQGTPSPDELRERLAAADVHQVDGWREAFRRTSPDSAATWLPADPRAEADPRMRALMVDFQGWHGQLPPEAAEAALKDEDADVRRFAARSLPWAPRGSRDPELILADRREDPDERVRRTALGALLLASPPAALAAARAAAGAESPDAFALRVVGLLGTDADAEFLATRSAHPAALRAIGDLGYVAGLTTLTASLENEDPGAALAAAEGICAIAGFPPEVSDPPEPDTLDVEASRTLAQEAGATLASDRRWRRGLPFPWDGEKEEETTECVWLRLIRGANAAADPFAREIPDGFLSGAPEEEAECGA